MLLCLLLLTMMHPQGRDLLKYVKGVLGAGGERSTLELWVLVVQKLVESLRIVTYYSVIIPLALVQELFMFA